MRYSVSDTAEYGDYTAGPKIVDDHTVAAMKDLLTNIQNGTWPRSGSPRTDPAARTSCPSENSTPQRQLEQVGKELAGDDAVLAHAETGERAASRSSSQLKRFILTTDYWLQIATF